MMIAVTGLEEGKIIGVNPAHIVAVYPEKVKDIAQGKPPVETTTEVTRIALLFRPNGMVQTVKETVEEVLARIEKVEARARGELVMEPLGAKPKVKKKK